MSSRAIPRSPARQIDRKPERFVEGRALACRLMASSVPNVSTPHVSYNLRGLLSAVPWLMLATALRVVQSRGGGLALFAELGSSLAIFLSFLITACRMIEITQGSTALGSWSFRRQLWLGKKILGWMFLLVLAVSTIVIAAVDKMLGRYLVLGVDGIAFDQYTYVGMFWSAFLAAVMLLMMLQVERTGSSNLFRALSELAQRAAFLLPAIAAIGIIDVLLSLVQGVFRYGIFILWHTDWVPQVLKGGTYFLFIFGFASLRLWITIAILIFALRESYIRRSGGRTGNTAITPRS